ncbi:hypothetical protein BDV23DRAFT_153084 [Aspergillus alliaceus]|uniref:Uncharacterized protein n=1 Tax=Petromyces alliaceus TaxID=209559 RepID=A0A5N7CBC0_PETAA|nr:hypothetical protein BDV23DRAFT_153084 [Aspergillus alliaceus]
MLILHFLLFVLHGFIPGTVRIPALCSREASVFRRLKTTRGSLSLQLCVLLSTWLSDTEFTCREITLSKISSEMCISFNPDCKLDKTRYGDGIQEVMMPRVHGDPMSKSFNVVILNIVDKTLLLAADLDIERCPYDNSVNLTSRISFSC